MPRTTKTDATDHSMDDMIGGTALAPAEPESGPAAGFDFSKKFDASETTLPYLRIAQGLSPEVRDRKADSGDFLVTGFDPMQTVQLVIVGHKTNRRYQLQGEERARCFSRDGIQGEGDPGIACAECALKEWRPGDPSPDGKPKNLPPLCAEIDNWLCYSVSHGMPVQWSLKGTGAKASRFIKQMVNAMGMGNFALDVSAQAMSRNGRTWQEPLIKLSNDVTAEEAQSYATITRNGQGPAVSLPAGS